MNPAEAEQLRQTVQNQSAALGEQSAQLRTLDASIKALSQAFSTLDPVLQKITAEQTKVQQMKTSMTEMRTAIRALQAATVPVPAPLPVPPAAHPAPARQAEPNLPPPEKYAGDPEKCRQFLVQCELAIGAQPAKFSNELSKVAFVIQLLTGPPLAWATAMWEQQAAVCQNFRSFVTELRRVFDHPVTGQEAAKRLYALRQGGDTAAEYTVKFRTLAVESGWNVPSLLTAYQQGLSEQIKDELAGREQQEDLEGLIQMAIRVDNRIRERRRERRGRFGGSIQVGARYMSVPSPPPDQDDEPMQIGAARLSAEERSRRFREGRCLFCGDKGHVVAHCRQRPGKDEARQ